MSYADLITCDGTTNNSSFNCDKSATWQVREKDDRLWTYAACPQHLSQVATYVLQGERGELDIRRIKTLEKQ